MALTPQQVQIIRSTVPVLQEHGTNITSTFYKTVLEENPALHNIFNQTNQENNHQAKALAGSLLAYASHIDDLGALTPAVERITHKHVSLYIQPEHYKVVGEGLLRAMGTVLGDALTPEVLEAWTAAYWQLANIFIKKEEQMYSERQGWTGWRDFTIARKVKESEEITSFYLKPVNSGPLPAFLPGQYISLLVDVPHFGYQQSRQYSLSDSPNSEYYRISVKREAGLDTLEPTAQAHPGWISNILHGDKRVGDLVKLSHPAGDFFFDHAKDLSGPVVLLSAGVGITPMISILNHLVHRDSQQHISFIHGARSTSVQAFSDHVHEQAKRNKNVHPVLFVKNTDSPLEQSEYRRTGRLDLAKLDSKQDLHIDDKNTTYFVCGPESFMAYIWKGLGGMNVDAERIKMEVFGTGDIPL